MRILGGILGAGLLAACGKPADPPAQAETSPAAPEAVEQIETTSRLSLSDFEALAEYSSDWTVSDTWPGEFPTGFAVLRGGVSVPARGAPKAAEPADQSCPLEALANYQAWNDMRNEQDDVQYFSASQAFPVTMTQSAQVEYVGPEGITTLDLSEGDQLIYQHYMAEGFAAFEYNGEQLELNEAELRDISDLSSHEVTEDQWIYLTCADGVARWVLYADALQTDGIVRSPLVGPGETGDLTEEQAEELLATVGVELDPLTEE